MPDFGEIEQYRALVMDYPPEDPTELFGLHPNAALSCRLSAATSFLSTLAASQQTVRPELVCAMNDTS